jgi:glutamine amidotransferase
MCRLLGIVSNKPIDLEFSLERFKIHAKNNPDGWGIGWYVNGKASVFKQGLSALADKSELAAYSKNVISKIIIAHVRKATQGNASTENTHPFRYKNWIFAHNGSVDKNRLSSLLSDRFKKLVRGETDSEVYFYWIMQNIEKYGDIEKGIRLAASRAIKTRHTGLNFLLSDGNGIWAFRQASTNRSHYSLYLLERDASGNELLEHLSQTTRALLRSKRIKGEKAVLICSEELTDENWQEIQIGEIISIDCDLNVRSLKGQLS